MSSSLTRLHNAELSAPPLFYLGKKILIVGDDKQISPDAVGLPCDAVHRLMEEFLTISFQVVFRWLRVACSITASFDMGLGVLPCVSTSAVCRRSSVSATIFAIPIRR